MSDPIQTAIFSLFAAIIGGFVSHLLSKRRDRDAKRRELTTGYKIELWRLIDEQNGLAQNKVGNAEPNLAPWESIVRDVQLFGSNIQIELVHEIVVGISSKNAVSFNNLLNSLQNDLRTELGMEPASKKYFWFRLKKNGEPEIGAKS